MAISRAGRRRLAGASRSQTSARCPGIPYLARGFDSIGVLQIVEVNLGRRILTVEFDSGERLVLFSHQTRPSDEIAA